MSLNDRISVEAWNDWEAVLMPWKAAWVDFSFVAFKVEYDKRFGNVELYFAVIGMHFRVVAKVAAGDVEFQTELQQMIESISDDKEA